MSIESIERGGESERARESIKSIESVEGVSRERESIERDACVCGGRSGGRSGGRQAGG